MPDSVEPQNTETTRPRGLYGWDGARRQDGPNHAPERFGPHAQRREGDEARTRLRGDADMDGPSSRARPGSVKELGHQPIDLASPYAVKDLDCLSVIAERVIRTQGGRVNASSINAEVENLIRLNEGQFKGLRQNPNLIRNGWQLRLTDGSEPTAPAPQTERIEPRRAPQSMPAPEVVPDTRRAVTPKDQSRIPQEDVQPVAPLRRPAAPPADRQLPPTDPAYPARPYYEGRESRPPAPRPRVAPRIPAEAPPETAPPPHRERRIPDQPQVQPQRRLHGPAEAPPPPVALPQRQGEVRSGLTPQPEVTVPVPDPRERQALAPPRPADQGPPIIGPILNGIGDMFRSLSDRSHFYINQADAGYRNNGCVPMSWAMANADWNTGHAPTKGEADYWVSQVPRGREGYEQGIQGVAVNLRERAHLQTKAYINDGHQPLLKELEAELRQGHTAIVNLLNDRTRNGHYIYVAGLSKDHAGRTTFILGDPGYRARQEVSEQEMQHFLRSRNGFAAIWKDGATVASNVRGTAAFRYQQAIAAAHEQPNRPGPPTPSID